MAVVRCGPSKGPAVDLFMQLRDHIGDQPAPTRLVRCAQPASILAVEIFMEQDMVLEVRVRLHLFATAEYGASARLVAPEDARQTAPQLVGNLLHRLCSRGSDGAFHPKVIAEEFVE